MGRIVSDACHSLRRVFGCTQSKALAARTNNPAAEPDAVIFVDCDGVLNVAIADGAGSLPLDSKNLALAHRMMADAEAANEDDAQVDPVASSILAVASRNIGRYTGDTYDKFVATPSSHLSRVLVRRLAKIIRMAGDRRMVVLTSTWRNPKHAARVKRLEEMLSDHLGVDFAFDATTPLITGRETPQHRVNLIGDFLSQMCAKRDHSSGKKLKALVLDDFDCTAIKDVPAGEKAADSVEKIETYLEAFGNNAVEVKVVHMHDEWCSENGQAVTVGAGLTIENYLDAAIFLGHGCDQCRQTRGSDEPSPCGWRCLNDNDADDLPGHVDWQPPMHTDIALVPGQERAVCSDLKGADDLAKPDARTGKEECHI